METVPIGAGMEPELQIHTAKNAVDITGDRVHKAYRRVRKGAVRFRLEVESLRRLAGMDGIPLMLECSEENQDMVMSRIPGVDLTACTAPPDSCFAALRVIVAEMLRRGVARHTLPPRDVIVRPDGRAGLVDFERVTLRRWRCSPLWGMACIVTRFNMLRLIHSRAPHLLSKGERLRLGLQRGFRNVFHVFIAFRHWLRIRLKSGKS